MQVLGVLSRASNSTNFNFLPAKYDNLVEWISWNAEDLMRSFSGPILSDDRER